MKVTRYVTQMSCCPVGCQCETSRFIDVTYQNIVQSLHSAACDHCPLTTGSFFKSYWDEEMSELKQRSIDTHQLWQVCGRPRSGPIYRDRCRARAEYRRAMRYRSKMANVRISNDLHEQLLTKDCTSFWRTWKNKVNNRHTIASQVDGYSNASDIATVFAKGFHQACLPNSPERNAELRLKFQAKFNSYSTNSGLQWITVDLVDKCVRDMKLGKAAGIDGIEAEHLRYAHPRICVILALLYNAMIIHGVVPSMFGLGIVVPLIKGHNLDNSMSENYRGIALSTHISKIFEMCILDLYSHHFVTSDLQFGFKKGLGCSHALNTVRSIVQHYTAGNSTVNLCALDMAKAFDKVNHYALFIKLLDRGVPLAIMNILVNWYSVSAAVVRWDNMLSGVIQLMCGVRQGGVLSPVLFAVYVNDIIVALSESGAGCYYDNMFVGCVMYADDLLLLSASLYDLQSMVSICCEELDKLDMRLNLKKSQIVRIGRLCTSCACSVVIDGISIEFVDELKYLGWYVLSSKSFKISLHHMRVRFYQCFNSLYAKCSDFSEPVLQYLVNTYCKPYLLYGSDVIAWNKSDLSSISHAFNSAMCKIYKVKYESLACIYQFTGQSDIAHDIQDRRSRFITSLHHSHNEVVSHLARAM